jgi:hypothetical protein
MVINTTHPQTMQLQPFLAIALSALHKLSPVFRPPLSLETMPSRSLVAQVAILHRSTSGQNSFAAALSHSLAARIICLMFSSPRHFKFKHSESRSISTICGLLHRRSCILSISPQLLTPYFFAQLTSPYRVDGNCAN